MPTQAQRKRKIKQRIHREELKLARLKTKANKSRAQDARMKLRLGGFIFVIEWDGLTLEKLADRFQNIAIELEKSSSENNKQYKIIGENVLRKLAQDREYDPAQPRLSPDELRRENHKKITIGGLMVKYGLNEFDRGTLFGALLEYSRTTPPGKKVK